MSTDQIDKHADDRRPTLAPPQLRLSSLFWVIAILCAIFAVLGSAGPYAAFALILFVLAIFAHVSGNALGTQLRDNGNCPIAEDGTILPQPKPSPRELTDDDYTPPTRFRHRTS